MPKYTHLEWLNKNSLRSYPIREDQSLYALDGFEVPNDLLVDIKVSTPYETDSMGILSVFVTPSIISINFCNNDSIPVATVVFPIGNDNIYDTVPLHPLVDGFTGNATCGPAVSSDSARSLMPGHHIFSSPCWLEKSTCIGLWEFPVRSIRAGGFEALNGNVELVFSGDIRSTVSSGVDGSNKPSTFVLLELENQEDYLSKCQKVQNPFECGKTPVMSINGVSPDEDGNINLNFIGFDDIVVSGETILISKTATVNELCPQASRPAMPDNCGNLPGSQLNSTPVSSYWEISGGNSSAVQNKLTLVATHFTSNPFNDSAMIKIDGRVGDQIVVNDFIYENNFLPFYEPNSQFNGISNGEYEILDPYIAEVGVSEVTQIDVYKRLTDHTGDAYLADLTITYSPIIPCLSGSGAGSGISEPYPEGYAMVTKTFYVNIPGLLAGTITPTQSGYPSNSLKLLGAAFPLSAETYSLPSGQTAKIWQSRTYKNPFRSTAIVTISGYADGGVGINGNIIAYMRGETYQSTAVDPNQSYTFGISEGDTFTVDWIAHSGAQNISTVNVAVRMQRIGSNGNVFGS